MELSLRMEFRLAQISHRRFRVQVTGIDCCMSTQRSHHVGERPALDNRQVVEVHATADQLLQQLPGAGSACDQILPGMNPPGIPRIARIGVESPGRIEDAAPGKFVCDPVQ